MQRFDSEIVVRQVMEKGSYIFRDRGYDDGSHRRRDRIWRSTGMGAQRADVGSIRAIWAVQDRVALNADEEEAIERPKP